MTSSSERSRILALMKEEDERLDKVKNEWRPDVLWQCKVHGGDWNTLPLGHRPGLFYDTEYRPKPV